MPMFYIFYHILLTAFVRCKSCTGLIKGGPYHGGMQTIMCCNNTWPIIVTHLTHRDVDHWWQSPLQSTFLCLCTHLLQRCLGIFLSMRLGGEPPRCLPYMLRSRCSFAWQGSSFCRRNTSHGFSQYMFADIMFNTTSSIFINKPVRGTWFCCSWMKEILDTKPCP